MWRSLLYVPSSSEMKLEKSLVLNPDAFIYDLEDSVSKEEKEEARAKLRRFLINNRMTKERIVRINAMDTMYGENDVLGMMNVGISAILIPKATPQSVKTVASMIDTRHEETISGEIKIICLLETAYSILKAEEIIESSDKIIAVQFGSEDFTKDMGIPRTPNGGELFHARSHIALCCKAHGVIAIDTPYIFLNDFEGLEKDAINACNKGFSAKAAIHPKQIEIINRIFSPSEEQIAIAQRIVSGFEMQNNGVICLDGEMIDYPVYERAKNLINRSEK